MLSLITWRFLRLRCARLKHVEFNGSDESKEEEFDELGSESGSFGMFLRDIAFYVGLTPVGVDCLFYGGGFPFVPQFDMCTIYFIRNNDKLLFARHVVIENVLARAVVEIVLARR